VKTQTIVSHSEPCYAGVKPNNGTVNTSKSHLCYSVPQLRLELHHGILNCKSSQRNFLKNGTIFSLTLLRQSKIP